MKAGNCLALCAAALTLVGCRGFSTDAGMAPVVALTAARIGTAPTKTANAAEALASRDRATTLLRRPLTASRAVQIALLSNRDLQAAFNDLGVSEADYVRATLPPDVAISANALSGQGDFEILGQVAVQLFALATLPAREAIASEAFRAAQFHAAGRTMALAAAVARQYYVALAAAEQIAFLDEAVAAAGASAEYGRQLGLAGNLNKLEQAREDVFYAEVGAQRGDARLQAQAEREKLVRLMGLWGRDIAFTLPRTMPPLPRGVPPAADVERTALEKRLDIAAARHDLEALARQLGLVTATRWVSDVVIVAQNDYEDAGGTIGSKQATENGRRVLNRFGAVADITIPLYDFGESKVVGARESYLGAANRLAQRAIDARSQAREAWLRTRGKYDLARYYAERVLPLRKTILDQTSLQTNGMLADVTQLLLDARGGIASHVAAIAAKRDYFLAAVDLEAATTGVGPTFEIPAGAAPASNAQAN